MCRGDPVGGKILRWRSLAWWNAHRPPHGNVTHASRFNAFMDIDRQVTSIAGENWHLVAMNREQWAYLSKRWVEKYDVPWATGKQTSIENLTPHSRAAPAHHDSSVDEIEPPVAAE
ncbi:unnamed protein product [Symbiodinium sp. CCMP2456]|nr:unnamed protein product [Symbiodinium sp. CCMP2456]